jgi:glucose-6-phosphate isomerase, archaeal
MGRISMGQISMGQISMGQISMGQISMGQISMGQISMGRLFRVPAFETGPVPRTGEPGMGDANISDAKTGVAKTGVAKTGVAKTGVAKTGVDGASGSAADRPFAVTLDFPSGSLNPSNGTFVRKLSDMAHLYEDQEAVSRALGCGEDPVIYVGRYAGVPERPGNLAFLTTTMAAGTVGSEFYMTKGHYHVQDSGEMYLGLSGQGIMVMQTREGDFAHEPLTPSVAVYVPPGWAHRTVNTGTEPLVFLASYFAGAGHDYSSIERSGFSRRVYRGASGPEVRHPGLASGAAR